MEHYFGQNGKSSVSENLPRRRSVGSCSSESHLTTTFRVLCRDLLVSPHTLGPKVGIVNRKRVAEFREIFLVEYNCENLLFYPLTLLMRE